jgi:GT2 family glycosyltransferase
LEASQNTSGGTSETPEVGESGLLISVIVLNYNGARWLERCLTSLRAQTIFDQLEVIVADNASPDNSGELAERLMKGWSNGRVMQHGANLGFCEGNNRAALSAAGKYLFFLNNDTWLEPDCMANLVNTVEEAGAGAGEPLILDYEGYSHPGLICPGFDVFGLLSFRKRGMVPQEVFAVGGCSYFVRRDLFEKVGGFDREFFMYVDEYDLSWRSWVAGSSAVTAPAARVHHRGAANVNPKGGDQVVEVRTSDTKRFYTNRNGLMLLLKNCQHILLLLVLMQLALLVVEAVVGLVLVRRWSFVKRAYIDAVLSCWKLRHHIWSERSRIRGYRRQSDWRMLRFLRCRLNRWEELKNLWSRGMPSVSAS